MRERAAEPSGAGVKQRTAQLLAAELLDCAARGDFGVVVQDVERVDYGALLDALTARLESGAAGLSLRLALPGGEEAVKAAKSRSKIWREKDRLADSEETAVRWRNQKKRTIAVVASQPLTREASLRSFPRLDERALYKRLCQDEAEAAKPGFLRALWGALEKLGAQLPLGELIAYSEELKTVAPKDQSVRAPGLLPHLGLFPDKHLADQQSERAVLTRLRRNAELLAEIRLADQEEWGRVASYIKRLDESERGPANHMRLRLQSLLGSAISGAATRLSGLDFSAVDALWRGKRKGPLSARAVAADAVHQIEEATAAMLIRHDEQRLQDVAEEISQAIQRAEDEDGSSKVEDLNRAREDGVRYQLTVETDLLRLVRQCSSREAWGARLAVASERIEALTEQSVSAVPLRFSRFRDRVRELEGADLIPPSVGALADRLAALRERLLPYVGELLSAPIPFLAGRAAVRADAQRYLETYELLLQAVQSSYPAARVEAEAETEELVGWLLSFELYVFQTEGALLAALSPLHPLHLWRSVFIVSDLLRAGQELDPKDAEALRQASAEDLHLLSVAFLPAVATGEDHSRLLGHAGQLGRLPLYREAPRGVREAHGVRTVAELAQLLARLRPYARPGLEVVLVNAPRPASFVQALLDRADIDNPVTRETFYGLHLRLRYTQADARGWAGEIDELEDTACELLAAGRERGLASLSVEPQPLSWDSLCEELERRPAHLCVVVDPFEVKTAPLARTGLHPLTPWVLTREYRYNKLQREITVVPVAESHVFGTYQATVALLDPALKAKNPANLPQVTKVREQLRRLASASTWTALLDPHMVALARLGDAELIDRTTEGARQVTCYARDLGPFTRQIDRQLRRTHFTADQLTLLTLVRELAALEPSGILSLGGDGEPHTGIKGALGKLVATRWYRQQAPSGLAVSLDTEEGRRWLLAGRGSREQADLLGLCERDGEVILDVIEVKAHDGAAPYRTKGESGPGAETVEGHPVEQVTATLRSVAEIFVVDPDPSPLVRPRREVLREHLYTAVLRDADPEFMQRWYTLLNSVFSGETRVRLRGRVIHVRMASVASQPRQVCQSADGVPVLIETMSAQDVGLALLPLGTQQPESASALPGVPGDAPALEPREILTRCAGRSTEQRLSAEVRPPGRLDIADHVLVSSMPGTQPAASAPTLGTESGAALVHGTPERLSVLLGHERPGERPVSWQPGAQSNGFFIILGASGSGKTETLKVLTEGIHTSGVPVLILDFHGDVKIDGVRSEVLSHAPSSQLGINPMELDAQDADHGPYMQRQELRELLARAVQLGHRQSAVLKDALSEVYRRRGILDEDMSTWGREPPTLAEVDGLLSEWLQDDEHKSLRASIEGCRAVVESLFENPLFRRSRRLSVDEILSKGVRLDLHALSDGERLVVTDTVLRKVFRALRARGPIPVQPESDLQRFRLFVVIDEAKILSQGMKEQDRDRSSAILNVLITEARKFGLGMILATQMADHFSDEVKANAATWLVLRAQDAKEARKNAPNVQIEPSQVIELKGKGDGYLRDRPGSPGRRIQVRPLHASKAPQAGKESSAAS